MSTNREAKKKLVEVLGKDVKDAGLLVVVQQNGLNATQTLELRRAMRAAGVTMKVGKNTLAVRCKQTLSPQQQRVGIGGVNAGTMPLPKGSELGLE